VALDRKYLAGFFDGEGSIGIYGRNLDRTKTKRYYVLVVSLAQSGAWGKQVLTELKECWGGSVYGQEGSKKRMWKWNISADKAADFLFWLREDLILKKREADLALLFQKLDVKRDDNEEAMGLAKAVKQCKLDY
jgi:hypothetical protein